MSKKKKYMAFAKNIKCFDGTKIPDMCSGTYKSVRKAWGFEAEISEKLNGRGGSYTFFIKRVL
jgi:hypothetical protein